MTKLQRLIDKTFGDEKLYDDFVEYLNENERYIEDKWTTKTGWVDYLNDLFEFDLNNMDDVEMISDAIKRNKIPMNEDLVYEYDSTKNAYDEINENQIERYLEKNGNDDLIKDYENSNYDSIILFLKNENEDVYDEMLKNEGWTDLGKEVSLLDDLSSEYGNLLDDPLKSIVEDIISNEKLGDHAWFEVDENWNTLIEVDEKEVKEKLIDYISNSKEWKQRLNYLKNERKWKFRDFNEFLDNKLDSILGNTNSR